MKSFNTFRSELLTEESTEISTAMEAVLGVAYDAACKTSTRNQKLTLKAGMKANSTAFKKTSTYWKKGTEEKQIENLLALGDKIKKNRLIGSAGGFQFQSSGALTSEWKRWGGTNTTSKTDIVVSSKRCSVKNANGAQLMSAKKGEAKATATAASNMAPEGMTIALGNILGSLDQLEEHTTKGYYASIENLRILKQKGQGKKLYDYASQEKERYEKEFGDWEKKYKEGKALKKDMPTKPSKNLMKVLNPKLAKEIEANPTLMKGENERFYKKMVGDFEDAAVAAQGILRTAFNDNPDFKKAFVYEAASGRYKFGSRAVQTADYMLCWKPSREIQDFTIKVYSLKKGINSNIITTYAKAINVQVAWKSSASTGHKGYNVFQSLRMGVKEVAEKQEVITNSHYAEVWDYKQQLNEGVISEWAFWDKVKELTSKFVEKAKELWNRFVNIFKVITQKIKNAAQDGIEGLSNVLGFEMRTFTNADRDIRIQI
tara:strand:- start:115 stop:1575 length:1461 start_codon:yes stop_codon:yes gene_type:complete